MKAISYYWRLDSLAGNGYRRVIKDKLLGCYIDKFIKADSVYKWLGKPTSIGRSSDAIIFTYYYYDVKAIPPNEGSALRPGYDFLEFHFGADSLLHGITKGFGGCG
ncbi:MAG: hypothetical protein EOP51_04220 [Sphingobacteriales bacterium]|nr:MAG: hypothetical protein EOP51_04220 [Sphingobacteriales bacterium]